VRDAVFGIVEMHPDGVRGEVLRTPRVIGKELAQMEVANGRVVRDECTPRWPLSQKGHGRCNSMVMLEVHK